jgi:hypothetical protein
VSRYELVMIDWAGPAPFGEQMLALRNIAAIYLRGTYDAKVNFTHLLIEGKLTFRGRTVFGTFTGPRFFADFGTHNDRPWYCEFLLPKGRECAAISEDDSISAYFLTSDGCRVEKVDVAQGHASEDNLG